MTAAPPQRLAKVTLASNAVMSSSKPQMKSQVQPGPSDSSSPTAAAPTIPHLRALPSRLLPELYLMSEV